ncbi:MAG: 4Fe-4S cluster-binding domain-containing protein [Candidatus Omnitrophica bacterium]|nr:4Fe-4S cluster-binding domain-containing protein [Candidatus Omnitrophota bacterium]
MEHKGEEPVISGTRGSGTIFFSGCTLACVYCQNYKFSQAERGKELDDLGLAELMINLQKKGCHNINCVTPTHVLPQILKALVVAVPKGLSIPIVYNTSGYELPEIISKLDGIIDIYLPDMRYADDSKALAYSFAKNYVYYNRTAVQEMFTQVKKTEFDGDGIMHKGLIIRHLVLPGDISGTEKTCEFISHNLSKETYISLMSQYTPFYKAATIPELSRRLTNEEYAHARDILEKFELENGWVQESFGAQDFAGVNIEEIE